MHTYKAHIIREHERPEMDCPVKFKVPLEVIQEADRCPNGHACLSDPHYRLCGVEIKHGKAHVGILTCGRETNCPYSSHIGIYHVCICPIRQEIFRKYQI